MRRLMIALAVVSLMAPALAQEGSHGSKHRGGGEQKTEQPKSKANDKDYKSALDRIPEQKYDPWGTTRPGEAKH